MPLHSAEQLIARLWPPERWIDFSVLMAVSGGADSVALLRALAAIKAEAGGNGRLIVAHFNHGLRAEAAADAAFVAELAERLKLPIEIDVGNVSELAATMGDGVEAAARAERYRFLQSAADQTGARYIVTAHTADDQAETIMHRILRGTSVAGLGGIRRTRMLGAASLIRPILDVRRAELHAYLQDLKQPFREDASNANREFTRNRIRHELLPKLAADYNGDIVSALLRLGQSAREAHEIIERHAEQLLERSLASDGGALSSTSAARLNCQPLANEPRHLVREVFVVLWRQKGWPRQDMNFAHWESLAALALSAPEAAPQSRTLPGNILAQKTSEQLSLVRL